MKKIIDLLGGAVVSVFVAGFLAMFSLVFSMYNKVSKNEMNLKLMEQRITRDEKDLYELEADFKKHDNHK